MQIKMIAGRNFDRKMSTDLNEAFLINETAARQLNWAVKRSASGCNGALEWKAVRNGMVGLSV
jgi:hypothetical protein